MDGTRGRDVGLPSLVFQADSEPHSLGGDVTRPEALLTDRDRRERVGDPTRQPFINILHLVASFSGTGAVSRGSAFLTNACGCEAFCDETFVIALTAAHVVCPERSTRAGNRTFDRRPEDIAQSLRVAIAAEGPVSKQEFTLWRGQPNTAQNYGWYEVAPSWLNDGTPETADTRWSEDYAALFLKKAMLPQECMGFHVMEEQLDPQIVANTENITCAGYPAGNKWNRTMLWAAGRLRIAPEGTRMVISPTGCLSLVSHPSMDSQASARHDADTECGQSGSPLYVGDGHDYAFTALAMHHKGTPPPALGNVAVTYNEALLVDSTLIAKVKAFPQPQGWMDESGGPNCEEVFVPPDSLSETTELQDLSTLEMPQEDNDLYTSRPTACAQDNGVSGSDPLVGALFQHERSLNNPAQMTADTSLIVEEHIRITRHPQAEIQVPFGENAIVSCEAISIYSQANLYFSWFEQTASGDEPISLGTGSVLRLPYVQHDYQVFCVVSNDLDFQTPSEVCQVSVVRGAPRIPPMLPSRSRVDAHQGDESTNTHHRGDGVEGNLTADVDPGASAAPDNPWDSSFLCGVMAQLRAEMDAGVICNRLPRHGYLSADDVQYISAWPTREQQNTSLMNKIKARGWQSLKDLHYALALTSQTALAERLRNSAKVTPGYVGFPIPQIEATPAPRLTVLTEENIATCNEKLNTLHIKAVASRLCNESRLMQFSLGARVSSTDLEFHCPRDRNTSLPEHALRVVTYLANERDVTVARALRLAKFAGCPLSVREALLEVSDPMEGDNGERV